MRLPIALPSPALVRAYHVVLAVAALVQPLSRVQLFATPWIAARQASLSITNSQSLLKLMFIEPVMPSNHLILCRPLLLPPSISPSIRVFSNESAVPIRWPKYWNLNFSNNPSNEYSVLVSFRIDLLDLTVQGLSRVSSNTTVQTWLSPPDASTAKHHFFFGPVNSSFLELLVTAVCSSQLCIWTASNLGAHHLGVSFCLFILSTRFSQQESWHGLLFPPPRDHILSELFTMTHPSWVALCRMVTASLSYISPFAVTRLWSMKGIFSKKIQTTAWT